MTQVKILYRILRSDVPDPDYKCRVQGKEEVCAFFFFFFINKFVLVTGATQ